MKREEEKNKDKIRGKRKQIKGKELKMNEKKRQIEGNEKKSERENK